MAVGWEPRWVRKRLKMGEGIEVETCLDVVSGLILCPLCVDISRLCPSYTEPVAEPLAGEAMLFFAASDLFHHMRAHARAGEWRPYALGEEEEEEESEEIEEESEEG